MVKTKPSVQPRLTKNQLLSLKRSHCQYHILRSLDQLCWRKLIYTIQKKWPFLSQIYCFYTFDVLFGFSCAFRTEWAKKLLLSATCISVFPPSSRQMASWMLSWKILSFLVLITRSVNSFVPPSRSRRHWIAATAAQSRSCSPPNSQKEKYSII